MHTGVINIYLYCICNIYICLCMYFKAHRYASLVVYVKHKYLYRSQNIPLLHMLYTTVVNPSQADSQHDNSVGCLPHRWQHPSRVQVLDQLCPFRAAHNNNCHPNTHTTFYLEKQRLEKQAKNTSTPRTSAWEKSSLKNIATPWQQPRAPSCPPKQ